MRRVSAHHAWCRRRLVATGDTADLQYCRFAIAVSERRFADSKAVADQLAQSYQHGGLSAFEIGKQYAIAGDDRDNASLPGVKIDVIMGRHAGFLTAASALARVYPDDGPHLIYLPERAFDMDQFLKDVQAVYARLGRCMITVSEGISDKDGVAIASKFTKEVDSHGNVQLSGTGALGVASGQAAETYALLAITRLGDEIVSANNLYGGTYQLFHYTLLKLGRTVKFVDSQNPEAFRKAINAKTRAVFAETIGNPKLDVPDFEALAKIAHERLHDDARTERYLQAATAIEPTREDLEQLLTIYGDQPSRRAARKDALVQLLGMGGPWLPRLMDLGRLLHAEGEHAWAWCLLSPLMAATLSDPALKEIVLALRKQFEKIDRSGQLRPDLGEQVRPQGMENDLFDLLGEIVELPY